MENQRVTAIIAIDLSAAFDTVDHDILLDVLNKRFGISHIALGPLNWFVIMELKPPVSLLWILTTVTGIFTAVFCQNSVYVEDGETMMLSCSGGAGAWVTWFLMPPGSTSQRTIASNAYADTTNYPRVSVVYNKPPGQYSLTMTSFNGNTDSGTYTCSIGGSPPITEVFVVQNPRNPDGPRSVIISGNTTVEADGVNRLTLTCKAVDYSPGVNYQWRENNQDLAGETSNTYSKIAQRSDNGRNITCQASNSRHSSITASQSRIITVYYTEHSTAAHTTVTMESTQDALPIAGGVMAGIFILAAWVLVLFIWRRGISKKDSMPKQEPVYENRAFSQGPEQSPGTA